ncbi:MAG TPA: pyrimidine 5'-nucleotidase, partial [Spirochaetales bacterium]|nr:pyrimidine 5'-nucleotidase [Spirochaetales bacterium]
MITTLLFDLDNTLYSPRYGLEEEVVARMNTFVTQVLQKPLDECKKIRAERLPLYGTTLEWLMAEHGVTDYEAYFKFVHPEGEESALEPDPVLK